MRKTLIALLTIMTFISIIPLSFAADPMMDAGDGIVIQSASGPFTANPYATEFMLVGDEQPGNESYIPSNRDGTFGPHSPIDSYDNVDGLVIADFDNDGDFDFILGNGNLGEAYLYKNDGAGTFTPTTVATGISPAGGFCSQFRAGDIDGDGWIDWVGGSAGPQKWWFRNNHDGTFTANALDVS